VNILDQIAFDQITDERDKAQRENKQLKERIKRLEEAGDAIETRLHLWKGSSQEFIYDGDAEAVNSWRKAKEAKP
jgi:hypothetical protein